LISQSFHLDINPFPNQLNSPLSQIWVISESPTTWHLGVLWSALQKSVGIFSEVQTKRMGRNPHWLKWKRMWCWVKSAWGRCRLKECWRQTIEELLKSIQAQERLSWALDQVGGGRWSGGLTWAWQAAYTKIQRRTRMWTKTKILSKALKSPKSVDIHTN